MDSDSQVSVSAVYISAAVTRGPAALDISDDVPENGSHPVALAMRNSLALMRTDVRNKNITSTFRVVRYFISVLFSVGRVFGDYKDFQRPHRSHQCS